MSKNALKELLYKMADDALILGHRNSEWTGLGPILEEDIAFSSMAQDKIGHALALYKILHEELGEAEPDKLAFHRKPHEFRCCKLVEVPNDEYDFSLARHFLFDHADFLRYSLLENSSHVSLKNLAEKIKGELKYHILHADTWLKKLGNATEESKARMQSALNRAFPFALGIFEKGELEKEIIANGFFPGEDVLKQKWQESILPVLNESGLKLPALDKVTPEFGGRKGEHTEHLALLLDEMTEVFKLEPDAEW